MRVERDGLVAVLIHPHYGAGWSTAANDDEKQLLMFDPHIVDILLREKEYSTREQLTQDIKNVCALKGYRSYIEGAEYLAVTWIPKGQLFIVDEYEGYENVVFPHHIKWIEA
jgi:hypothetical protein